MAELNNKVDASRRAEKCGSLRVKVEAGVSGCALRPVLPSAPYSLPPQRPFRPILPSAPYSLPPHTPVRPILPSAPYSRPPQARFHPRLASAAGSPYAAACPACVGWVSANLDQQKPSVAARCVSAGLHRCEVHAQLCVGSQTHLLPSCRVARHCAGPRLR